MSYFIRRPALAIALLTGVCLLAFWLSIPLPRIDNQLVGSDGVSYYIYLPSFWLDGDLDFTDEYRYFRPDLRFPDDTLPPNKYTVGAPLLWSPFFLAAHGAVTLLNVLGLDLATDGYGYVYQAFTLSGTIVYGGLAMGLTYLFARRTSTSSAALIATVLTVFAGNLVYYMVAEPSMSHAMSAFAGSLFFLTWSRRRDRFDAGTAVVWGLLGGLMALVRPQDGLCLSLPFLSQLPTVRQSLRGEGRVALRWLRNGVVAAATAFAVFSVQLLVWHHLYGGWFRTDYADERFRWLAPRLGYLLFSGRRGLFIWHPVFLLSILGLILLYRRDRTLALVALGGFAIQWYLLSSWTSWSGDSFGVRMLIVCTPLFAVGLAPMIEAIARKLTMASVYVLGAVLLGWNFLIFVEYRFDLVLRETLPTWHDVTVGRVTFLIETVRDLL